MRYYIRGQRSGSDKHVYAPRSRFIAESDIAAFDVVSPPPDASAVRAHDGSTPRVDLKQAMRKMWIA